MSQSPWYNGSLVYPLRLHVANARGAGLSQEWRTHLEQNMLLLTAWAIHCQTVLKWYQILVSRPFSLSSFACGHCLCIKHGLFSRFCGKGVTLYMMQLSSGQCNIGHEYMTYLNHRYFDHCLAPSLLEICLTLCWCWWAYICLRILKQVLQKSWVYSRYVKEFLTCDA